MIAELPFTNSPAQKVIVQLGEVKYSFFVKWNGLGFWTMDIGDLIVGIPLLLGTELLEPYNFGIGRMIVVDDSGQGLDAGIDDLGNRIKVFWSDE